MTAELNHEVETFAGELKLKTEESSRQKEEMTSLLAQVAELHKKIRQVSLEAKLPVCLSTVVSVSRDGTTINKRERKEEKEKKSQIEIK